jgi:hypothetical protein
MKRIFPALLGCLALAPAAAETLPSGDVEAQYFNSSPSLGLRVADAQPDTSFMRVQGSKDELFGITESKEKKDVPAGKSFKVNGFYDFLGAYTFAEPRHWSRAVNRLQLSSQGALGGEVKWKVGARFDADPVYAASDFYLPAVRRDQKKDFFWRENYLDFSAGPLEFRVGAQNIVWGEVVGLFFADVVSGHDLREFLLPSFDIIRKPQWAARAEYFKDDSHLEVIFIPVQTFDDIGKPGADFYPVRLPSPTPAAAASAFLEPDRPARNLGNSAYGFRANTLVGGWDLAGFYYRSFANQPTFYRLPGTTPLAPVFQPRYDRIWQTGFTVSKDFSSAVLRGEAVYSSGQRYASTDPFAPDGVVRRNAVDWVVGLDFSLPRDGRFNVQVFQRHYFGSEAELALHSGTFGVSALLSAKVTPSLEPQILWIQTFGGGGSLVRPLLKWFAAKNTTVGFGVDIFTGPADGFFGRYNNRDRVYTELRYDF